MEQKLRKKRQQNDFFEVCNIFKQKVLAGAFLLTNGRMERERKREVED